MKARPISTSLVVAVAVVTAAALGTPHCCGASPPLGRPIITSAATTSTVSSLRGASAKASDAVQSGGQDHNHHHHHRHLLLFPLNYTNLTCWLDPHYPRQNAHLVNCTGAFLNWCDPRPLVGICASTYKEAYAAAFGESPAFTMYPNADPTTSGCEWKYQLCYIPPPE